VTITINNTSCNFNDFFIFGKFKVFGNCEIQSYG
jgi:hypothetical protein